MNVEKQYIELYHNHTELINRHAAPVLNAPRAAAMAHFEACGFPSTHHEEYKHTRVAEAFAPDYGLNIARHTITIDPNKEFRCDVPNISTSLYYLANDTFVPSDRTPALPEGVLVGSLQAFAQSHPQLVERYYGKLATTEQGGAVALNTALVQDGFFLYVPANVVIEKPLQLVNILHGAVDMLATRRILVILEERAEAKLLVCDHTHEAANYLTNQVVEVYVGEGAHFDYYEIEEASATTRRFNSHYAQVATGASYLVNGITLTNGITRNNYHVTFTGEHAEAHLYGMAIADKAQQVDNYTYVDHAHPHCNSTELFKYILNDQAIGAFSGRVLVREGADKTTAMQNNRNLCLAPTARMYTKPQLEIYADDVKCSHGATVGQLDSNALFYLQTRGISLPKARMLLMYAFTNDVIDTVRLEPLADRLKELVERRLSGEGSHCNGACRHCK